MRQRTPAQGYTLIELLILIAIIGILATIVLAAMMPSRNKAIDARIRNDIAQLRWEAEIVFDSQSASYANWSAHPTVANNITVIMNDLTEAYGGTNQAVIRDSDSTTYCVSAPLVSTPTSYYCLDATGAFKQTSSHCPVAPPFACPS